MRQLQIAEYLSDAQREQALDRVNDAGYLRLCLFDRSDEPVLDIIAYWTKNPDGTIAGTIRLAIMLFTELHLLML